MKQLEQLKPQAERVKELQDLIAKYDGIDPDKAKEALDKLREINEKNLIDAGKIDEVVESRVNQRVERLTQDFKGKVSALEKALEDTKKEAETYKGQLTEYVIDNSLQRAVQEVAVPRKGAIQDILHRGKRVYSLSEDGKPIPRDPDGNVMYGKDGKSPMSMTEWAQSLLQEAPYLFESNSGGGASGNDDTKGAGQKGVVTMSDGEALSANLEQIAAGEVEVVPGQ